MPERRRKRPVARRTADDITLTPTQAKYLGLFGNDHTIREIARLVGKTDGAVESVLNAAQNRLFAHDYTSAYDKAKELGLIQSDDK